MKNLHIFGVPLDIGARPNKRGADKGPDAIRKAAHDPDIDMGRQLSQGLGYTIYDRGNIPVPPETLWIDNPLLKNLESIVAVCTELAKKVEQHCSPNDLPLVLGGDHSIAMGSVTGVAKRYKEMNKQIGILWIDAHADFNTAETTPSGNIHGMPLAALAGRGDKRLVELNNFTERKVDPANIAIVGARYLDPGEKDLLRQTGVSVFTMEDIDREGIYRITTKALEVAMKGTEGFHVSFDMDALDPLEAPGVGTPVAGGLTYREARQTMELIALTGKLTSLDIVEVNPVLDREERTATLAVELILSALGRRFF